MSYDEKILGIENKIIDIFTMVTWWTEVRFDKNNLYWAAKTSIFSSLFFMLTFLADILQLVEEKKYTVIAFMAFMSSIGLVMFLVKICAPELMGRVHKRAYPQGTPNPCRISKRHSFYRRMSCLILVIAAYFLSFDWNVSDIFFFGWAFMSFCEDFFLSCDSLPPQEKLRRRIQNEQHEGTLLPTHS